jgi:predicted dehydrogenase
MNRTLTRRQALAAGAASLGFFYAAPAFSAARILGANQKLYFAGIGVGGKGSSDIDNAAECGEVVAICDIDTKRLEAKANQKGVGGKKNPKLTDQQLFAKAQKFTDFRKLYDDAGLLKTIDAIVVSTPDHLHALASLLGIRNKKHVYCQKPLTHDVYEAHLLRSEAKKHGVCTQMGNQGTTGNGLRRAVELVRSGVLGAVQEAHVWTNRPAHYWKQSPDIVARPKDNPPVPSHVHWEEWLGPAAARPYNPVYHPHDWRGFWDFGTGAIGDMACHTANMAFMALKLAHPTRVSAESGDVNPETCPAYAHVTLDFPARGDLPPVTLHWYEGKKDGQKLVPPADLVSRAISLDTNEKRKVKLVDSGSILVGSKGIAYSPDDYGAEVFFSTGQVTNGSTKPENLPINNGGDLGQKKEWVEAIQAGKPELALSNFGYAGLLAAAFLLGNVAIRTGKPFTWDGEACRATDLPEAMKLIRREYRKGWDLIGYNG